jgi:predicted RNA methylase
MMMEASMADGPKPQRQFSEIYADMMRSEAAMAFSERHNVRSAPVLTVVDDETAALITERLAARIEGRTVVEIGGGIGLLSLHMASVAKRVYCIEANPVWSFSFVQLFLEKKPKNLSFLFGAADEFVGCIRADVAIICTHSDVGGMTLVGQQFAPIVVDVYGELVDANPEAFDAFARRARRLV